MGKYDAQRKPITYVILHHTVTPENTTWKTLSNIGRTRTYAGYTHSEHYDPETKEETFIAYHWLVYQDGTSRRCLQDNEIGWHAGDWDVNCAAIAISFVGNFVDKNPSEASLKAAGKIYKLYNNAQLKGHREIKATACPGRVLDFKQKILDYSKESEMAKKIVIKGDKKAGVYAYEEGRAKLLVEDDFKSGTYEWGWMKEVVQAELERFIKINNFGDTLLLKDPNSDSCYSLDLKNKKWKSYTSAKTFLAKYEWAWLYTPDKNTYDRLKRLYTSVEKSVYDGVEKKLALANTSIKSLTKSLTICEANGEAVGAKLTETIDKYDALFKLQIVKEKEFDELVKERDGLSNKLSLCESNLETTKQKYEDDMKAKEDELKIAMTSYETTEKALVEQLKQQKEQCELICSEKDEEIAKLREQNIGNLSFSELFQALLSKLFKKRDA